MLTLTTTIQQTDAKTGTYLAVTKRETGQEICSHTFTYLPGHLVDLEPQWLLDKPVLRSAGDTVRGEQTAAPTESQKRTAELATYGQRLFSHLFGDGQKLGNFLEFATGPHDIIPLTLALHPAAAPLWRLPWEYLHDGRRFLALDGRFHLSRRPEGLDNLSPEPVTLPLRLLVIVASPDDQELLDTEEEIGVIQDALDEAMRLGRVQVEYLDDATLENIGARLREFRPHAIHFTGHGVYDGQQKKSYLALEDDDGATRRAAIDDLLPHLRQAADLRLVTLSACQSAQTSDLDAFRGVATGLLNAGAPAVVAMQFAILDNSAIQLAGAFYGALARGENVAAAVQAGRVALAQFKEGPGYDWGVPALYQRAADLRLVEQAAGGPPTATGLGAPAALVNMQGLPLPRHFVGRKRELRQLRAALRDNRVKAAFVRGIGGMGKSSVAAKLLQRPGTPLDGALVIRCHEVDPLDIPLKLASFLQAQGVPGHAEAGALLLESRLDPAERAQAAAERVAGRRYLFVFDNFETLQATAEADGSLPAEAAEGNGVHDGSAAYDVADPTLRGLLAGLLRANWRSLCLFTGRFRWRALDEPLAQATAEEIHLPQLTGRQTIMLMDNLPRLKGQPIETKIKVWRKVGGHPKSIELLNGWLAQGRITDLLDDAALDKLLAREWEEYFLRTLLARLPAGEREALARLAVFQDELGAAALAYAGITEEMKARWLDLSLLQLVGQTASLPPQLAALLDALPPAAQAEVRARLAQPQVLVHPVVAGYLLGQTAPDAQRDLHRWAAAYYGRPFVEIARDYAQQTGQSWSDERIESFARSDPGVVGFLTHQTQDMGQARGAMARALAWQRHLFAAGEVAAADDIVNAVCDVLARWGQRDQAKRLLRRSIESLEGGDSLAIANKAVAQGNLATLLQAEGRLDEALAMHQELYDTFTALNAAGRDARQQMAAVLAAMSNVYTDKGDLEAAVEKQEASLRLREEIGDEEGQASSLHQLAILHHLQGDYPAALARSQAAETLARKLGNDHFLAAMLHEQGLIYNQMAWAAAEAADGRRYRQQAAECFQASLAIKRRIDNEAGAADTLGELGKLLLGAGQMGEAVAAFNEALEIDQRLNRPVAVGIDLEFLGSVHEAQGEYAAALAKYQEALALFRQYSHAADVADTERNIARVRAKMAGG